MKKEKKINGSPEPVSISGTRKILDQLIHCVCKIKVKGASGTGFFCKIPLKNNETFYCLMTNYHILDEVYYKENKDINILINDGKEIKTIDIKMTRKTFFDKGYDIAIIELKQSDKIQNFLELDDNLFIDKEDIFYVDKSIYILQYPKGKYAMVSYGLLNGFSNYDILHTCTTDDGSSGSPILNLESNKVIGIHKEGSIPFNFNKGTFLKLPLNSFISQNNNNETNENNYYMVLGPNISLDNNNQINIVNNFNNIFNNNFVGMNNYNFENNNMNLIYSNKSEDQMNNNLTTSVYKMNIIFSTREGNDTVLIFDYGTTVDEMLKTYLKKENKLDLYGLNNKIGFIYNVKNVLFGNKTPIEIFFKNRRNPKVQVCFY